MKSHRRLMQSLADIEGNAKAYALKDWLRRQPGSVRRGYQRGRLVISAQTFEQSIKCK